MKDIVRMFNDFLAREGAYCEYYSMLEYDTDYSRYVMSRLSPSSMIEGAFEFNLTPSGYYYWYDLNNKWLEIINNE